MYIYEKIPERNKKKEKKMRTVRAVCLTFMVLLAGGIVSAAEKTNAAPAKEEAKKNLEKVYAFLKEAGVYFLATADGDQPKVRPFGTVNIFEGRLYIQTGRKKNVSKQIAANGKVEICALRNKTRCWIRITGTLVDDPRIEAKKAMLDAYPGLKKMYRIDDPNTQVLYFAPGAKAVIYTAPGKGEEFLF